jgi:hypothetical protein
MILYKEILMVAHIWSYKQHQKQLLVLPPSRVSGYIAEPDPQWQLLLTHSLLFSRGVCYFPTVYARTSVMLMGACTLQRNNGKSSC